MLYVRPCNCQCFQTFSLLPLLHVTRQYHFSGKTGSKNDDQNGGNPKYLPLWPKLQSCFNLQTIASLPLRCEWLRPLLYLHFYSLCWMHTVDERIIQVHLARCWAMLSCEEALTWYDSPAAKKREKQRYWTVLHGNWITGFRHTDCCK